MARIRLAGIAKRFGAVAALEKLDLEIADREFMVLLGPSGCGKTTTLNIVAGLEEPSEGQVFFDADDVTDVPPHRREVAMVFQSYALYPQKSVAENIAFGLRLRGMPAEEIARRVRGAAEQLEITHLLERRPSQLSGGQRQRVALGRAIVRQPRVFLMDEPLSNLDTKLRHQVRETIGELQREAGITTLFVTHDQEEALAMSDRIAVMNAGRFEQVGTPAEIYRTPCSAYVADFIGAANIVDATIASACEAGALATAQVQGGRVAARCPRALPAGAVRLVLRPEDISLAPAGGGDGLAGCIARRQYLGSRTSYAVELAGGLRLSVDRSGEGHDRFAIGDAVALLLDPARCLAIAP